MPTSLLGKLDDSKNRFENNFNNQKSRITAVEKKKFFHDR